MKNYLTKILRRLPFYNGFKTFFYSLIYFGPYRFHKYDLVFFSYLPMHLLAIQRLIEISYLESFKIIVINRFRNSEGLLNIDSRIPILNNKNPNILRFINTKIVYTAFLGLNKSFLKNNTKSVHLLHSLSGIKGVYDLKSLNAYDYIIASSISQIIEFRKLNLELAIYKGLVLIPGGYPKLDQLIHRLNSETLNNNNTLVIVYAPTYVYSVNEKFASLRESGNEIINELLNHGYSVIFRPHPTSLLDSNDAHLIRIIANKYKENEKFRIDYSIDYFDVYKEADLMITDISGTGFTFSLAFLKPTIFFDISEFIETHSDSFHLNDRDIIGGVARTTDEILSLIKKLNFKDYRTILKDHRDDLIFNIGSSDRYIFNSLKNILDGKDNVDWIKL